MRGAETKRGVQAGAERWEFGGRVGFRGSGVRVGFRGVAVRVAAVLLALVVGASATAEDIAWNAEEVLAIATELDRSIAAVLREAPKAGPQDTAFQQRTRDAAVTQMKRAKEASANFLSKLQLGWDRDETEPHFRYLSGVLKEVRETAGDAEAQPNTEALITRIFALRFELEQRYEIP